MFALTFVVSVLLGDQIWAADFRIHGDTGLLGAPWVALSAPFALPEGLLSYAFAHFGLQWFLGGRLERFWGTKRYLLFALGCGIVGSASAAAALGPLGLDMAVIGGPVAIDAALLLAFAVTFGREHYALPGMAAPLSGRAIALLAAIPIMAIVGISRGVGPGGWPQLLSLPGALLVAAGVLFQPWRRGDKTGNLSPRKGKKAKASHLRVVRSPDDLLN